MAGHSTADNASIVFYRGFPGMSKRNKISNQKIEKHYFEQFRRVYPLPVGNVKYSDRPDVIIEDGPRKIGIEITNFYLEEGSSSESEQAQIKLRKKVVSSAQQNYQNGNGRKIEISFGFNNKIIRQYYNEHNMQENGYWWLEAEPRQKAR